MLKKALILMIALEAVSLLSFIYAGVALPLLIAVFLAVFVLTLKRPELGVYVLLAELFVGSRGRLLEHGVVSLRMVVFAAVLLGWLINRIMKHELRIKPTAFLIRNSKFLILYLLLLLAVGWGIVWGYTNGNGAVSVFNDANAYLYLLIFPVVLSVIKTREQLQDIFQILGAAILVIALKGLLLYAWFAGSWVGVSTAYNWVINQDIGEITGVAGSASRIFMQSQFWALVGLFIFAIPTLKPSLAQAGEGGPELPKAEKVGEGVSNWIIIAAALFSVILSLSRSLWLGAIAGSVFAVVLALFFLKAGLGRIFKFGLIVLLIVALELGGLYVLTEAVGEGISGSVASRLENPAEEAAGSARLLLLPELLTAIGQAPAFGHGFGKALSYPSFLPDRVTPGNPEGRITAFAFEWGYLDIMLKIGGIGLLVYLMFIANIFKQGWRKFRISGVRYQVLGILAGLVTLVVLNVTTPYLNHPLGIGYLALASVCFSVISKDNG